MNRHRATRIGASVLLAGSVWFAAAAEDERASVPAPAKQAQEIFATHCAGCHGTDGRGHGPRTDAHGWWRVDAADRTRRPRDFTQEWFRFGDSVSDIERTLMVGSDGTAMEGFNRSLSPEVVTALAAIVLDLRGPISNAVIRERFPDRIPNEAAAPSYHRPAKAP